MHRKGICGTSYEQYFSHITNDTIKITICFEYLFILFYTNLLILQSIYLLIIWTLNWLLPNFLLLSFIFMSTMVIKDITDGKVTINLICNNFLKIQTYNNSKQQYNPIKTLSKHYYLLFIDLEVLL